MSAPKRYRPISPALAGALMAAGQPRPLIPEAPIPQLVPLARGVRIAMGGGRACELGLGWRAYQRIRSASS